jgi:hypothetical protein
VRETTHIVVLAFSASLNRYVMYFNIEIPLIKTLSNQLKNKNKLSRENVEVLMRCVFKYSNTVDTLNAMAVQHHCPSFINAINLTSIAAGSGKILNDKRPSMGKKNGNKMLMTSHPTCSNVMTNL